jgi:adenine deaminase
MVEKKVAWSPTMSIYEASRDVIRAQNQPWFKDYLHPALEAFFRPDLGNHGSYFVGWTNTQEARWRQQYRIWMDALKEFGVKGGIISTGDDAGFIYSMYGFGLIRELELHEEAGFHPLEVIEHGTWNGARVLGLEDKIGKVRVGFSADLLVVNGNPLENLRLLNPAGADVNVNGRNVRGGGVEWTIKEGIPYHAPTLMKEVKDMVTAARKQTPPQTTAGQP